MLILHLPDQKKLSLPNVKTNIAFPKMNKGLVLLLERTADQMARILHAGIEPDKKTSGEQVMMLCRIAYQPVTSRPSVGPEIDERLRIFLGEGSI